MQAMKPKEETRRINDYRYQDSVNKGKYLDTRFIDYLQFIKK